jgi:hypothetical protein
MRAGERPSDRLPLVVDVGGGVVLWVQDGKGWQLRPDGVWLPFDDDRIAPGLGGTVLTRGEVNLLIQQRGRPS